MMWLGIIIGIAIGALVTMIAMAICITASKSDKELEFFNPTSGCIDYPDSKEIQ